MLKLYGVSEAYLLGGIDTKYIGNKDICNRIAILDNAIHGLESLKKQQEEYLKCDDDRLKSMFSIYQNGFLYMDIVSYIIADTELWETILYETEKVMAWHKSDDYRYRFEQLLNEDGECNRLPLANQIELKEISSQIIAKAISKTFNNYISSKLKELHIKELSGEKHDEEDFKKWKEEDLKKSKKEK